MNIFKAMASGKDKIRENQMTAILAWLLHPQMEHGLGYEFLNRFIQSVTEKGDRIYTKADKLKQRLRGENVNKFLLEIEDYVKSDDIEDIESTAAFLDILVKIDDDWIIGIENKIKADSVIEGQLNREYRGLVETYGKENNICILIFLVPINKDGKLPDKVKRECTNFCNEHNHPNDFLKIMTWQKGTEGYPSTVTLLKRLLLDEAIGKTSPINEYTKHTIKALIRFICDDFKGYDYPERNMQNGAYEVKNLKRFWTKKNVILQRMSN